MHTQIVLARGFNDGKELEYSARELFKLYPNVQTMAVVPVGMTKFREGLTEIKDIDEAYAKEVIGLAKSLNNEFGCNFIQLADEFYFRAGLEVEPYEFYGSFPQIENGVGTTAKFLKEIDENLRQTKLKRKILLISGTSAGEFIKKQAEKVQNVVKGLEVKVLAVKNDFFGETVNCTGLLTGQDILRAIVEEGGGYDIVVMPCHVLREKTDLFLDGMTVKELSKKSGKKIRITNGTGESFVKALSSRKF